MILNHLHSMGFTKKVNEWVSHQLNETIKENRLQITSQHLSRYRATRDHIHRFLYRIVTGDVKWCLSTISLVPGYMPKSSVKLDLHPILHLRLIQLEGHDTLRNARKECHSQQRALHSSATLRERAYSTEITLSIRTNHTPSRQCQAPCCTNRQSRIPRARMGDPSASELFFGSCTDGLPFFFTPCRIFKNEEDLKN